MPSRTTTERDQADRNSSGVLHAGRERDVQIFDGQLAGDQAGEEEVAGSSVVSEID